MRLGIMRKSKSAASIRSKRKQKKKKRKKEEEEASDSDYISLSPLAIYSSDSDQYPTAVRGQIANTPQSTKLVKTYSRREPLKTRRFGDLGSEFDALREFDVYASGDKEVESQDNVGDKDDKYDYASAPMELDGEDDLFDDQSLEVSGLSVSSSKRVSRSKSKSKAKSKSKSMTKSKTEAKIKSKRRAASTKARTQIKIKTEIKLERGAIGKSKRKSKSKSKSKGKSDSNSNSKRKSKAETDARMRQQKQKLSALLDNSDDMQDDSDTVDLTAALDASLRALKPRPRSCSLQSGHAQDRSKSKPKSKSTSRQSSQRLSSAAATKVKTESVSTSLQPVPIFKSKVRRERQRGVKNSKQHLKDCDNDDENAEHSGKENIAPAFSGSSKARRQKKLPSPLSSEAVPHPGSKPRARSRSSTLKRFKLKKRKKKHSGDSSSSSSSVHSSSSESDVGNKENDAAPVQGQSLMSLPVSSLSNLHNIFRKDKRQSTASAQPKSKAWSTSSTSNASLKKRRKMKRKTKRKTAHEQVSAPCSSLSSLGAPSLR